MFNWREYTAMVSRKAIRNNPLEIVAYSEIRYTYWLTCLQSCIASDLT